MKIPLTTVEDAGIVIRTLRKHSGIRIDDFALHTARPMRRGHPMPMPATLR